MRKVVPYALLALTLGCGAKKMQTASINDDTYGYSQKNPIKVGGFSEGPANERKYLSRLTGPNGEPIAYERKGSCCAFETDNSPFGSGLLDIYEIEIDGDSIKKIVYINMYDKDELYAPKGFLME